MNDILNIINNLKENTELIKNITFEHARIIIEGFSSVILSGEVKDNIGIDAFEILAAFTGNTSIPFKQRWALYQWLERLSFVNADYADVDYCLRLAYRALFYEARREVGKCIPQVLEKYMAILTVPENSVYVVTDQFLSSGHAPTRDVLDYSYTIQKDLGYQVCIINTGLLNFENVPYISGRTVFKFKDTLNNINGYEFKDVVFPFFQSSCVMPDFQELANLISFISFKKPALVLSVGGPNLLADLCRDYVTTAAIPCHTYLPRSMSDNLILCKDISHVDPNQLNMLEERQHIVESVFNYGKPDENTGTEYSDEQLKIDENTFDIAIVGNRLTVEIDDDFISMMKNLGSEENSSLSEDYGLEENSEAAKRPQRRVQFHIIGDYNTDRLSDGNNENIILHGKLENASQAIRRMDLLIQPHRTGGARAAYEALHYGIPVITTKLGDTWDVCGDEFAVENYDSMSQLILKYKADKKFYDIMSQKAVKRSLVLEDLAGTFKNIMDACVSKNNFN